MGGLRVKKKMFKVITCKRIATNSVGSAQTANDNDKRALEIKTESISQTYK
jgi:hypothetical protein